MKVSAKEMDVMSGEVMIFILRKLGNETNLINGQTIHLALTVLALASSKLFVSLRFGQADKNDEKPFVISYFHQWTALIHRQLTEFSGARMGNFITTIGEQNLSFFESVLNGVKTEKAG